MDADTSGSSPMEQAALKSAQNVIPRASTAIHQNASNTGAGMGGTAKQVHLAEERVTGVAAGDVRRRRPKVVFPCNIFSKVGRKLLQGNFLFVPFEATMSAGSRKKMRLVNVMKAGCVLVLLLIGLTGCSSMGSFATHRPYVRRGDAGFKPVDQVAPHARAMVQGKMSLADCLKQPESLADGGAGCLRAIKDLPVTPPPAN